MEYINSITLQGTFGQCNISEVGETRIAKFSLCTKRAAKQGCEFAVETSWHSCVAFEKGCKSFKLLESLTAGDVVCVRGRLKYHEFIDNNNSSHIVTEIVVSDVLQVINQAKQASPINLKVQA